MELDILKARALREAVVVLTTGKRNKKPLEADEVLSIAKKFEKYIKLNKIKG